MATTKKIRKFSKPQMAFHWTYGISWILLVLTGIIFMWRPDPHAYAGGLGPWLQGFIGQSARFIHRIA
ncbi:MAG: formate dehydrogenase gamma subunit, partial [Firmicutes bacterium]|nr:formate dehydrogenase gamma subunit [Bacillota bacterium]